LAGRGGEPLVAALDRSLLRGAAPAGGGQQEGDGEGDEYSAGSDHRNLLLASATPPHGNVRPPERERRP
jgi:hypothetical protein